MLIESARPHSQISRLLLDQAVEARMEYAEYLRAVAAGTRPADPQEKERLQARCEETLMAWRNAHHAWRRTDWAPRGRDLHDR